MNKLILSLAAVVMAFTSVAGAKTKSSNTVVAKAAPSERSYSSYSNDSFFMGSGNTHEFTTLLTHAVFVSEKRSKNASAGTAFDVGASYLYSLNAGVQVGGEGRLQILSKEYSPTGNSKTLIDLLGVAAYNFQSDLKNAFFLKAGLGIYSVLNDTESDYENKLGLFFGGGKRFALWNNVSYTPEARFVKKGDIDLGFQIAFLNFSVIW
ncbi:hypothetical protein [Bdellovibrio svalbardensis]|uniref:Outer membrane protein beta-barrel domain-containing protein n=1 Tax=Bdellovibrio svalbardensis TaxID=2972972 RepID=A0ABT6DHK6_9BACT|nr:hypothetical protein [Bdellovibrio svalbardensis]MDG0815404.1 hypothetical protein [Bdellovibrio svalbardensis]